MANRFDECHFFRSTGFSDTYSYNQKIVLKETVLDFIFTYSIQSMLDVGAGSIDTAQFYKNAVRNYVAVEQDKERAELLRKKGLIVVNQRFPCTIEDTFDLVLSSHSIPEQVEAYEAFLQTAWKIVNDQRYLMIITFKGASETLWALHDELVPPTQKDERVREMMRILQCFGEPVISRVTTWEKTKNPEDIAQELSRSFHLEYGEWREKLLSVLESRFKDEHGYFFPHEHLILLLKK